MGAGFEMLGAVRVLVIRMTSDSSPGQLCAGVRFLMEVCERRF
jgi:hypothetical protein